jgi:hypothetical protein
VTYESSTWRQRLHTIVFEADTPAGRAFDVAVIFCIITSVGIVLLESISSIGQRWHREFLFAEIGFTFLFTIEYVLRLAAVKRPLELCPQVTRHDRSPRNCPHLAQLVLSGRPAIFDGESHSSVADLSNSQACGREGHDDDAAHCKFCGSRL